MLLHVRSRSFSIAFCFIIVITFFPGLLHSQNDSYIGSEAKLSKSELFSNAESTDFGDNINAKIFYDEKNTYYAVDVSKLASSFEKIRLLELTFDDKTLVNISSDINSKYYLFLVNNTLNTSTEDINNKFRKFCEQTKTELEEMNEEQLRLWTIQHDKYSKK